MTRPNPFVSAADRYAEGRPYHHARTLRRALAGWTPGLALDVACGTGLSTRGLAELGIATLGVDVDAAMVARARADTGLPYAVASAEALPIATGAVDLVTVGSAVHWSAAGAQVPGVLSAAAARCSGTRPGGCSGGGSRGLRGVRRRVTGSPTETVSCSPACRSRIEACAPSRSE